MQSHRTITKTTPHSRLNVAVTVTDMNTVYIVDSCQCSKFIVTSVERVLCENQPSKCLGCRQTERER